MGDFAILRETRDLDPTAVEPGNWLTMGSENVNNSLCLKRNLSNFKCAEDNCYLPSNMCIKQLHSEGGDMSIPCFKGGKSRTENQPQNIYFYRNKLAITCDINNFTPLTNIILNINYT